MTQNFYYDFPIGKLGLAETDGGISHVTFHGEKLPRNAVERETPLIQKAAKQLHEYFARKRTSFDLPLALAGTPFQLAVWKALTAIPCGETRSYADIAAAVGSPKGFRAVGMANNRNPVAIIVPCHRVIGKDGSLTGYAGGLHIKEFLLELERPAR